jgi:hypothetical protein
MAAINPCSNISFGIQLPIFECTNSIHPNFGNLVDFGRGLGSLPGQLATIADCVEKTVAVKIQTAIDNLLHIFNTVFGSYPWSASTPLFGGITIPEFEMEVKMRALFHEFKIFLLMKFLDILSSFVGPILNIPIPFLSGCVIGDLLTPTGRTKIKSVIVRDVDAISNALGLPWSLLFSGELGMNSPEFRAQSILTRIYVEIQNTLNSLLFKGLNALLAPINFVIKTVIGIGLPTITNILNLFNFENIFDTIWSQVKNLAISTEEKIQKTIDYFMNFDIGNLLQSILGPLYKLWTFGTKLSTLLNFSNHDWNIHSPEFSFERTMSGIKAFFNNIATMIYELFLKAVHDAISTIENIARHVPGIGTIVGFLTELFAYIPFTFCSFIGIVATPLLTLGGTVSSIIPPEISVNPFVP